MSELGLKFVGKDQNGISRAVKTDEKGNIGIKERSNPSVLYSGIVNSGSSISTDIIDIGAKTIDLNLRCNIASNDINKRFEIIAEYYNQSDQKIYSEIVVYDGADAVNKNWDLYYTDGTNSSATLKYSLKYGCVKFIINEKLGTSKTIVLEYATSQQQEVIVRKSPQRKITYYAEGDAVVGQGKLALVNNHTFEKGTTAWGLYFMEATRPLSNVLDKMYIRIEMTSGRDYAIAPGGRAVFRQDIPLSTQDEFDKGLVVDTIDVLNVENISLVKCIIIAGKYFNIPMGERITISLINTNNTGEVSFLAQGVTLVEEGSY